MVHSKTINKTDLSLHLNTVNGVGVDGILVCGISVHMECLSAIEFLHVECMSEWND